MQKVNVNLRNGGEVKSRVEFGGKVVGTHVLTHIMCIQQKHLKTNEIHHIYFTRKIRMCACAKREEKDQYKFPAKESDDLLRRKIGWIGTIIPTDLELFGTEILLVEQESDDPRKEKKWTNVNSQTKEDQSSNQSRQSMQLQTKERNSLQSGRITNTPISIAFVVSHEYCIVYLLEERQKILSTAIKQGPIMEMTTQTPGMFPKQGRGVMRIRKWKMVIDAKSREISRKWRVRKDKGWNWHEKDLIATPYPRCESEYGLVDQGSVSGPIKDDHGEDGEGG